MHRFIVLAALIAAPGFAAEPEARFGEQTRGWLELQKSGAQASPNASIVSGEQAERIYQRYLQSFESPIPEHFQRVSFGDEE